MKQQLALSRERDEEDEAFADFDRVGEEQEWFAIASSMDIDIDTDSNNSLDTMDLTDLERDLGLDSGLGGGDVGVAVGIGGDDNCNHSSCSEQHVKQSMMDRN